MASKIARPQNLGAAGFAIKKSKARFPTRGIGFSGSTASADRIFDRRLGSDLGPTEEPRDSTMFVLSLLHFLPLFSPSNLAGTNFGHGQSVPFRARVLTRRTGLPRAGSGDSRITCKGEPSITSGARPMVQSSCRKCSSSAMSSNRSR